MTASASRANQPKATLSPTQILAVQRGLLAYLARQKGRWLVTLVSIFLATLATSLALRLVAPLLDEALPKGQNPATQAEGVRQILFLLLSMSGLTLLGTLLIRQGRALAARLAQDMLVDLRADLYASLLRQHLGFFRQNESGKLTSIAMSDAEVVGQFFTQLLPSLLVHAGQLALALVFMTLTSWPMMVICVLLAGGIEWASRRVVTPRMQGHIADYRQQFAAAQAVLGENLPAARDIQIFTQETRMAAAFRRLLQRMAISMTRNMNLAATNFGLFYGLGGLALALIYGIGALLVIRGWLEVGLLVSFAAFFIQFFVPVKAFSDALVNIQSTLVAAQRVFELMNTAPVIRERADAKDPGPLTGHIRYENVSFSYDPADPDGWRLANVNLEIKPGEKAAFVGGSGTGKSTLVNLVARFYDVTEGRVTIDGHDVRDLKLSALRRNFGMVAQDVLLLQGTVADNIRFARPDATTDDMLAAAEVGNVTEFIDKLDDGYDTRLGAGGAGLSGGQRQRVSIARAALPKPALFILDEPTSALDTQSEELVMRALDQLCRGRTALIITHRLNTILNADKIVVMGTNEAGHGVVRAVGTHEQLLETCDEYIMLFGRKTRPKAILMPIGPLYNTVPILPTVTGLARGYNAPVYVLDFGILQEGEARKDRFGVELVIANIDAGRVPELNRAHLQRVEGVQHLLKDEGIQCHVVYPPPGLDWIEATIHAIDHTQATHLVAMENVLIPLEDLRESIRRIERKGSVEYILVDPTVGAMSGYAPVEEVRGPDRTAMDTVRISQVRTRRSDLPTVPRPPKQPAPPPVSAPPPTPATPIPQLNWLAIIGMFLWPALWQAILLFGLFPLLRDVARLPLTFAFLIPLTLASLPELAAGAALAWGEGASLKTRLGLAWPASLDEWGRFAVMGAGLFAFTAVIIPIEQRLLGNWLAPPAGWPDWATLPLWALLAWLQVVNPLITILGEELYYRGYLLPKMQGLRPGVFGRLAWPLNALLFVLKQSPQAWLAFRLENIAAAFAAAYYGQRRQLWASLLLRYIGSAVMVTFWLGG
jgi:ABC-type multidrug transport system fused ATPase/permease subunit